MCVTTYVDANEVGRTDSGRVCISCVASGAVDQGNRVVRGDENTERYALHAHVGCRRQLKPTTGDPNRMCWSGIPVSVAGRHLFRGQISIPDLSNPSQIAHIG